MPLYKYRLQPLPHRGRKCPAEQQALRISHRLPRLPAVLETLPLKDNSDDFVFDNQMLAQALAFGFPIGEVSCPTKYFTDASSINFRRSVTYGIGVLKTALAFRLHRWGIRRSRLFEVEGQRLEGALAGASLGIPLHASGYRWDGG